jgi:hypothetical protein
MTETSNGSLGKLTREETQGAKALKRIANTAMGRSFHDLYLFVALSTWVCK